MDGKPVVVRSLLECVPALPPSPPCKDPTANVSFYSLREHHGSTQLCHYNLARLDLEEHNDRRVSTRAAHFSHCQH